MKKFPGLSLLLAFLLAFQILWTPALATEAESSDGQEVVDSSAEQTQESSQTEPEYTIPQNVSGDASVNYGCKSINASVPLIDQTDLEVKLGAALMYEINSGTLLYAYNADERMYPASVTKVMTCLLALEYGNIDDIVTISDTVIANRDPNGSNCELKAGEQISLKELLYCLMVSSANDAACAISEHIAGSEEAFVELMNQKASELGCTNTNFANPHGLHDENHYTSARDLAKIMLAALEYDTFREIYSTRMHEVPATNKSEPRNLLSTNYLIEKSTIEYYYDERVIGGKTGFTTPAGRCLAAVSEDNGLTLLTVVLGGETKLNDSGVVNYYNFEETGNLIDYGFANFSLGQILNPDAVLTSFPVAGGENQTQAAVKEAVGIAAPVDLDQSQLQYEYVLDDGTLTAPIEAGDPLGVVRVWYQSKCLAQEEIYATVSSNVKQTEAKDPAVSNNAVAQEQNLWQIVLLIVLALLALIVVMLVISMIRSSILRAKRRRRRKNTRRRR